MTAAYRPLSGVVVRAPRLPVASSAPASTASTASTASATLPGPAVAEAEFAFAVVVASPDLVAAADTPAARAARLRYLIRAATRPTPFGGFAGVAVARWADRTDLGVAAGRWPTRTSPDMAWLTGVAERLGRETAGRVHADTAAFERGGRLHLSEPAGGGPDVSIRATPVVRRALAAARAGIGLGELRRRLLDETAGATADKVDRLLDQLREQRFLLPELLPALIGDPLEHVVKQLDEMPEPAAAEWSARLTTIATGCRAVDAAENPERAVAALAEVRGLVEAGGHAGVRVDTALPLTGTGLTRSIAEDVRLAVDALLRLGGRRHDRLAGYRDEFHRRYGDQRRVPVTELVDPRFGLGHPGHSHADHGGVDLRELAATAIREGRHEVELDEALLGPLPALGTLPRSLELSVFVAATSTDALDRGDYLLVVGPNLGGQAAGRGLGRFADLLGQPATDLLAEAAQAEEAGTEAEAEAEAEAGTEAGTEAEAGPLTAELVYRPVRARSANVVVRPLVRDFELPVGVAPTLPPDRVLHLDELTVGLDGGRFQLWWRDRPVRLTSGHMLNSSGAPPICRTLLELGNDGTGELSPFDWGPMAGLPFLPRVRYGRVVLASAQWRPGPADLDDAWRERWRVPRHVYLASGDNRLLLDLADEAQRAEAHGARVLHEALPGPQHAWLPGPGGGRLVELVVPLVRTGPPAPAAVPRRAGPVWTDADRLRAPGSDWLYVVLHGPIRTEDELICGSLGELADRFVADGDADGWFFVRYADPGRQLRLRLRGRPEALVGRVLPGIAQWAATAIGAGTRTRMSLEVYERELERYGGPGGTAVCEALACADSAAVRDLLRIPDLDRMDLALLSAADLLDVLVGADRERWLKLIAGTEGGTRFREDKVRLRALLGDPPEAVAAVLDRRRAMLEPLARQAPDDVAGSVLHLHLNRLGLDRRDERVALGLLDRTLRSLRNHAHRRTMPRGDSPRDIVRS